TGPFKFVEFRRNEVIKLARNPDDWKKGRPYLDAIEVRIIPSRSTRFLAFVSGELDISGAMQPPPEGAWGMPQDMLRSLPGYGANVEKNVAEARGIMQELGYGPEKPLKLKVSTRDIAIYRDPAVILIDQLKK